MWFVSLRMLQIQTVRFSSSHNCRTTRVWWSEHFQNRHTYDAQYAFSNLKMTEIVVIWTASICWETAFWWRQSLMRTELLVYYLPEGKWTNYLTGEIAQGGCWRKEKHSYLSIPLWVRENSIVPTGVPFPENVQYSFKDNV